MSDPAAATDPNAAPNANSVADLSAQRDTLLSNMQAASQQLAYITDQYQNHNHYGGQSADWFATVTSQLQASISSYASQLNDVAKKISQIVQGTASAAAGPGGTGSSSTAFVPPVTAPSMAVVGSSSSSLLSSPFIWIAAAAAAVWWFFLRKKH